MDNWQGIAAIITAFGAFSGVMLSWVNSRMKRAERRQEVELERMRTETRERERLTNKRLSTAYSYIYGYLWKMLFRCDADRVGILQPHPLDNKRFFSTSFEILHPDRGAASHKENFQCMRMSEWGQFVGRLANDEWIIYTDVETIRDRKVYAEAHRRGIRSIFFKRMTDAEGNWTGTLYAEFITQADTALIAAIKGELERKATLIQDILPEYNPAVGNRN